MELNKLVTIASNFFNGAIELEEVHLRNATEFNANSMANMPKLSTFDVDFSKITKLYEPFGNNTPVYLGEISIPNLTTISEVTGASLFGLTKITKILNLGKITKIPYVFDYSIVLGDNDYLTYVRFPSTLTVIGGGLFNYYSKKNVLTTVIFDSIVPPTFSGGPVIANTAVFAIYVPDESLDAYKTATGWVNIASRIKPLSELSTE